MGLLPKRTDNVSDLRKEVAALRVQLIDRMEERIGLVEEALSKLKEDVRLVIEQFSAPHKIMANMQEILARGAVLNETIDEFKGTTEQLKAIHESLQEITELLKREREQLVRENQKFKAERDGLNALREEVVKWKAELEQKERQITEAQEILKTLMNKKMSLEEEIRVLNDRYLTAFEDAQKKLENFGKEMDKMFKLREIRMERMIRREKEYEEKLAALEQSKAEAERMIAAANRLREEVSKLEAYKESLSNEIAQMERRRTELNELITEMRRAFLTS
ncbi:MAG: hypothetical protein NZ570_04145 [Candidatus Caldarchaeum sp.]|nr:hypothetical protein [Candidatus Caldarchaeum sp.]MDW7977831.1 hypothetical protein [Candidatus Caldarchaeum sp.]MDW8360591.1 hypothetical protein [Candidatus Caldarchaeum sp.]